MDVIARADCITGGIYRIHSRNLRFGVYNGEGGFAGIREKFWTRSLFTEYHREGGIDGSGAFGTVAPLEMIGQIPDGVDPREGWWAEGEDDKTYVTNKAVWDILEQIESEHARAEHAAGRLWMGHEGHCFVIYTPGEGVDGYTPVRELPDLRWVDAEQYLALQDANGVCMGLHAFHGENVAGRIVMDRHLHMKEPSS